MSTAMPSSTTRLLRWRSKPRRPCPRIRACSCCWPTNCRTRAKLTRESVWPRRSLPEARSDRDVELGLAEIYTRLHRWKDADEALNKADALSTKQDQKIDVYFLRGALAERQKHYDPAEVEFRKILAIDPNNAMTLNYLGYMLADRGVKLDEALSMVQKAVQLDPQSGAYLDSLGWVYFKMGQYALSEANLRKASERMSTDPTVHDHLGELYEKTGRLKLAAAQWEQSLAEYARTVPADAEPVDVNRGPEEAGDRAGQAGQRRSGERKPEIADCVTKSSESPSEFSGSFLPSGCAVAVTADSLLAQRELPGARAPISNSLSSGTAPG